jgi:serine/threonine protein kinase
VLQHPSGPPLEAFLSQHEKSLYPCSSNSGSRISPTYLPLLLQWSLQLLSSLTFIHAHGIIFGDLSLSTCWLSSVAQHLSLSLLGFVSAEIRDEYDALNVGSVYSGHRFRLTEVQPGRFTIRSNLFDWATLVYELATGMRLAEEEAMAESDGDWRVLLKRVRDQDLPILPRELMGEIVRKCWMQEYVDAEAVRWDVESFVREAGFEVEEHSLRGFDAAQLFQDG